MRKFLLFTMVLDLLMILTKPIAAQDHGFGMGLILGEPIGLRAKIFLSIIINNSN